MEVLPLIRVVGLAGSSCEIRLTEGVEQKSSVLATMAGEWRAADDPGVMALDLRLSTCSRVVPSASVVCRFLDHLSGADAATPHALPSHTEGLLEVATFLGIETIDIFHEERWIGNRSDRLAQHARMQLARRETALLFAGTLVNAWFKTELRTAPHICFIFMQAPPNEHYPNTLAAGVDGQPFGYGLSAPFGAIPVVVGGRRPPSSTPPSAAEGTLPDQQRRLMNDLYQTCAVPEGRDLLVRMLSNLSYYVITRLEHNNNTRARNCHIRGDTSLSIATSVPQQLAPVAPSWQDGAFGVDGLPTSLVRPVWLYELAAPAASS